MERSAKSTWGYDWRAIAPMSVAGLSTASLRSEEPTQALKDSRRRTAKTAEKSARLAVRVGNVFLIFVCTGVRGGSCVPLELIKNDLREGR